MKKINSSLIVLAVIMGFSRIVSAAVWYVDQSAAGAGNGTSWNDAWQNLSDVVGVNPGDVVNISGGPTGFTQIYSVSSAWTPIGGSSGNPVTYQVGQDGLHNGSVVFNGAGITNNWIASPAALHDFVVDGNVGGQRHITVQGFVNLVVNAANGGSRLKFSYLNFPNMVGGFGFPSATPGNGIEIDHCTIQKIPDLNHKGLWSTINNLGGTGFDQNKIHDNTIQTPVQTRQSGGFIYGDRGDTCLYMLDSTSLYNNHMIIYNPASYVFQTLDQASMIYSRGNFVKIYNNDFENSGDSVIQLFSPGAQHDVLIYNNIFHWTANPTHNGVAIVINRYAGGNNTLTNIVIANNTFVDFSDPSTTISWLGYNSAVNCFASNNLFYNVPNWMVAAGGLGIYMNMVLPSGIFTDPPFVTYVPYGSNNDFHLWAGANSHSQVIDFGDNTSWPAASYFTTDKDGLTRPGGTKWDIGAYEWGGHDGQAPTSPTRVSASVISPSQIDLTWTPSTDNIGVTGYRIYRGGTLIKTVAVTNASDTGLAGSTAYTYTITAIDTAGNESAPSSAVTATTQAIPLPPIISGVSAMNPTGNSVLITWTTNSPSDSLVEYGLTASYGSQVFNGPLVTSHSVGLASLSQLTAYHYRVTSKDSGGLSSTSGDFTFTTADSEAPTDPTGLTAQGVSATRIDLTWAPSSDNVGVVGYKIYVGGVYTTTVVGTSTSSTGLNPNTSYTFRVSAVDDAGNESGLSAPATATTQSDQPSGGACMDRVKAISVPEGDLGFGAAVIDTARGYAYFGTLTSPGQIIRVDLSNFSRTGTLSLAPPNPGDPSFEGDFLSAAIDATNGFAFFGSVDRVTKINLNTFKREGVVIFNNPNLGGITAAVIDSLHGYGYFGTVITVDQPGQIYKVKLADLSIAGTISLGLGESCKAAVIDPANDVAYFGTLDGRVIKIQLSDFSILDSMTVNPPSWLASAVIDTAHGYAYFAPSAGTGLIYKIQLSDFTQAAVLSVPSADSSFNSAAIDLVNGYAYFAGATRPGKVTKIRLSNFSNAGLFTLNAGENIIQSAVVDPTKSYGYFGISNIGASAGEIVQTTLYDCITVGSIAPSSGPVTGGTSVTIQGSNFVSGATVKIGANNATSVNVVNSGQLTATTPSGTLGPKDVVVINPDGGTDTLYNGYTYNPMVNHPPVVNAGPDQTITLPAFATLRGTVTDDGLPNPPAQVSTTWSQVSGPGTVSFMDSTSLQTSASFDQSGTYVVRLTASDGDLQATDDLTIVVSPAPPQNVAPSVFAGPDQSITLPDNATLSGSVSDDGLPNPPGQVTVTWSKQSGPGTVSFLNSAALYTTANFSQAGTYVLRLSATDGALTTTDDITIVVSSAPIPNAAPTVNAGIDQTITLPNTALLSGTATDDGFPNPPAQVTVTWSKWSGPGTVTFSNAASLSPTATFSQAGTYILRLSATDGALTTVDEVTIVVNDVSNPLYTLTVVSGTGGGSFHSGTAVTITANAPPAGKVFDQWTGGAVADIYSSQTTLTMPAQNTSVTATYKDVGQQVTVSDYEGFNPFKNIFQMGGGSKVNIAYSLKGSMSGSAAPVSGDVTMTVYDRFGNAIKKLNGLDTTPGAHTVEWDGRNEEGSEVGAGVYLVVMTHGGKVYKTKVAIIK